MSSVYPKNYFKEEDYFVHKATCFVLMPFDEKFDEILELIKEALHSGNLNIECKRADDVHRAHILQTILQGIAESEFIIADLTDLNPNVFYELGIAHCIKEIDQIILLTQNMQAVPFDLRQFRCIPYEQSISGAKKLKQELFETFHEIGRDSFRVELKQEEKIQFHKKLLGRSKFLYQLYFIMWHVGHDAIKLEIKYVQLAADGSQKDVETDGMLLEASEKSLGKYLPDWSISLIRSNEQDQTATISIDKVK